MDVVEQALAGEGVCGRRAGLSGAARSRSVIYDESDEISLDPSHRSEDWRKRNQAQVERAAGFVIVAIGKALIGPLLSTLGRG